MNKKICFLTLDCSTTFNELLYNTILGRSKDHGYELFTIGGGRLNSKDRSEKYKNILYHWIDPKQYDAIITANLFDFVTDAEAEEFISKFDGVPVISLAKQIKGTYSIIADNEIGFKSLVKHLIRDRSRIAVVSGPKDNSDTTERLNTLRRTLNHYGVDPIGYYWGTYNYYDGIKGVGYFLDECKINPDAIVCLNDSMAFGVMDELSRRGISVPSDIKVTGFDNILESYFIKPSLTTVTNPVVKIGEIAVNTCKLIFENKTPPDLVILPTYFVKRASSEINIPKIPFLYNNIEEEECIEWRRNFGDRETGIRNIIDIILKRSSLSFSPNEQWQIISLLKNIFIMLLERNSRQNFIDYLETSVFGDPGNHKILNLILEFFNILDTVITPEIYFKLGGAIDICRSKLSEAMIKSYYYFSSSIVSDSMSLKIKEDILFRNGEQLSSLFDLNKMIDVIAPGLMIMGINTFFLVEYVSDDKSKSRLTGYVKAGRVMDIGKYEDFLTEQILPAELASENKSIMIEALHIEDELLGYIAVNNFYNPGLATKSLRHQISGALKGLKFVQTINSYSRDMEMKVIERTAQLAAKNDELKHEIVKREKLERSVIRNKNLESLSILAGGIAHDFNNYLTGILANLSLLKSYFPITENGIEIRDPKIISELKSGGDDIEMVTKNAITLTKQLLTFSKGGEPVKKMINNLAEILEENARFILRGTNIKPIFKMNKLPGAIYADQSQLVQILHNIIINAVQSMGEIGTITFELSEKEISGSDYQNLSGGKYAEISITDTGSGIREENLDKIFDPYYTTKSDGTGLGLATSIMIARKHNGDILVSSRLNVGTTFRIYMPIVENVESEVKTEISICQNELKSFKILILEDDPLISKILSKILIKIGHSTTAVDDGEKAVAEYKSALGTDNAYDLLILDLTINGGMGGKEALDAIRKISPAVNAIVSSGYSDVPIMSDYRSYGFNGILQKPYDIDKIIKAIKDVMGY